VSSIFVARQPIFQLDRGLYGYELLYRRSADMQSADGDVGFMSADVIMGSLLGIGLPTLSGTGVAFVNFSRAQLLNQAWRLFEPAAVVIELLESITADPDTVAACRDVVDAGYQLALDDYVFGEETRPLLDFASIVKVDVLGRDQADLRHLTTQLAPWKLRLLAERVETAAVRDMCAGMGYELFQGYLFSRPEMLSRTDVSASQIAVMRLLNLLQDPRASDSRIEDAFQSDLALSYKLLRIVNAAAIGGRGISSIGHAVRLVGRDALHRWLAVMLVASIGRAGDVSHEIALTALTRARMCELLAHNAGQTSNASSGFIVGLLSLLDVLLEVPMDKILGRLELSDDVRDALLERKGALAPALNIVEAYESAEWDSARQRASELHVPSEILPTLYVDGLRWAADRLLAA